MNLDLLKGAILSKGMTQAEVAESIGVSLSRFNAKINHTRGAVFTLQEAKALKALLDLSMAQIDEIFLS